MARDVAHPALTAGPENPAEQTAEQPHWPPHEEAARPGISQAGGPFSRARKGKTPAPASAGAGARATGHAVPGGFAGAAGASPRRFWHEPGGWRRRRPASHSALLRAYVERTMPVQMRSVLTFVAVPAACAGCYAGRPGLGPPRLPWRVRPLGRLSPYHHGRRIPRSWRAAGHQHPALTELERENRELRRVNVL
jgi:hypothetical protein